VGVREVEGGDQGRPAAKEVEGASRGGGSWTRVVFSPPQRPLLI
jgi:hypothetical protein